MAHQEETRVGELGLDTLPVCHDDEEKPSGLGSAHRGYVYQDVATAYFLARAVVDGADRVTVDRKEYEGDLFDDLTIEQQARKVRQQFKFSADAEKPFAEEALKTKTTNLRIDDIVHCFLAAGENPADEYRICVTWSVPDDVSVAKLLQPTDAEPSFEGYPTKLYRLNVAEIWPEGGELIWNLRGGSAFNRNDLVAFAKRLIVELECPQISLDLAEPGPLQIRLRELLAERIGVGHYPNRHIRVDDAVIRLTHRASLARAGQESLSPQDVLRALNLRTDYGRIAQTFPVVGERQVSRDAIVHELLERVKSERRVALIGPPGSGKSWILTELADRCVASGVLVIRHYCYLEPGDELLERRITSDVLFGNLVGELIEAEPTLRSEEAPKFAAGPRELELLLAEAHHQNPERQILLVVDGLDHVERVGAEAKEISASETRLVEELASLELPDGACLLLGSQPGSHLAALDSGLSAVELVGWSESEIRELADRLGALSRVREAFGDNEAAYVTALHERSEGNPLYATYLCRETRQAIESGDARGAVDVVRQTPQYAGDLNNYYRYLVGGDVPDTASGILAYIDFSVTRDEFAELYPVIVPNLDDFVAKLAPVITDVAGQGGLRVYHESFRRFIVESLADHPEHRKDVLRRITDWLESRGFPQDSRAYRNLFAYMLRQSRPNELLKLVGVDFVSKSLEYGHAGEAILQNVAIAAQAAAAICDWPSLCRIAEVRKSVDMCLEEKFDFEVYTNANLAVNGADRVADQLLFDGKPTRSRDEGLIACARCDQLGVTPPWREYLELDGSNTIDDRESAALAEFLGHARLSSVEDLSDSVADWFRRLSDPPSKYATGILRRFAHVHGVQAVLALAQTYEMPERARFFIYLSTAQSAWNAGEFSDAADRASRALKFVDNVVDAIQCLEFGADSEGCHALCPNLAESTKAISNLSYPDEEMTRQWVAAVRVFAFLDPTGLVAIRDEIAVDGWYRAWLRFAISISLAVARSRIEPHESETLVVAALEDLAAEESPFRGTPRACDLYSIRHEIQRLWRRAVSLIKRPEMLDNVLRILSRISESTTTYLQSSPGGPLTMDDVAAIGEMLLAKGQVRPVVTELLEHQVERAETGLYSVQAPLELKLATAYATAGQSEMAQCRWQRACQCLAAYGERRDITVYELINSVGFLVSADAGRTYPNIADLQRLIESLDGRTDGKDTKGALVNWFGELATARPDQAAVLLGRSLLRGGGLMSWRLEEALVRMFARTEHSRPDILLALWFTSQRDDEDQQIEHVLTWIGELLSNDRPRGETAFRRLQGRVQDTSGSSSRREFDRDRLHQFAEAQGVNVLLPEVTMAQEQAADDSNFDYEASSTRHCCEVEESPFPNDASLLQILRVIKGLRFGTDSSEERINRFVDALGYRLLQLALAGRVDDAAWLITAMATETSWDRKASILAAIAEGLERYNQPRLAALAFALAGWNCRTEFILSTEIDELHLGFIERATMIDAQHADSGLASDVARSISTNDGYYFGVTARVIQIAARFFGADVAFACWTEGYRAIKHRLPEWQTVSSAFLHYNPTEITDWSVDEALAFLLLSRVSHPDLERKQSAITGLAELLRHAPADVLNKALQLALTCDTPLTSVHLILSTLLEAELPPFVCSRHIADSLRQLKRGELYGLRAVAERLLARLDSSPTE